MNYIGNAFSLQMIAGTDTRLQIIELSEDRFRELVSESGARSVIGHPDTARVLGFQYNRETVALESGDTLFVAQLSGGRLPEGAIELPEGFSFRYMMVIVE